MTIEGDGQPSSFTASARGITLSNRVLDGCREFLGYGDDHQSVMAAYCTNCGCHRNFHRKEEIPMLASGLNNSPKCCNDSEYLQPYNKTTAGSGGFESNVAESWLADMEFWEIVRSRYAYFDNSSVQEPDRSDDIPCIYFAAGNCRKGKFCRFSHYVTIVQNVHELAADRRQLPQQRLPVPIPEEHLENVEVEKEDREPKRERTRFMGAQKEAMRGYAERLGWRLRGHDQRQLFQCCWGIGISVRNFKCLDEELTIRESSMSRMPKAQPAAEGYDCFVSN